jgi:hypothetical protein
VSRTESKKTSERKMDLDLNGQNTFRNGITIRLPLFCLRP